MTDISFDCIECKSNVKVISVRIYNATHYIQTRLELECGHHFTFNTDYD